MHSHKDTHSLLSLSRVLFNLVRALSHMHTSTYDVQMEQPSVSMDRQTPLFVQQQRQQLELMRAKVGIEKQLQYQLQYVETYIQHQLVVCVW